MVGLLMVLLKCLIGVCIGWGLISILGHIFYMVGRKIKGKPEEKDECILIGLTVTMVGFGILVTVGGVAYFIGDLVLHWLGM